MANQRFKFRLRSLFHFDIDSRHGLADEFIVLVYKTPYWQKTIDRGDKSFSYISKYEYRLIVDLWLAKISFRWVGREQDAQA